MLVERPPEVTLHFVLVSHSWCWSLEPGFPSLRLAEQPLICPFPVRQRSLYYYNRWPLSDLLVRSPVQCKEARWGKTSLDSHVERSLDGWTRGIWMGSLKCDERMVARSWTTIAWCCLAIWNLHRSYFTDPSIVPRPNSINSAVAGFVFEFPSPYLMNYSLINYSRPLY